MPFKFFLIPVTNAESVEPELNAFVRAHRVLSVDRRWVEQGNLSFWGFCVDYLDPRMSSGTDMLGRPAGARGKVDYRDVLKPDDFIIFAKLRDMRKEIATRDAVPVYTIFTNEQLAQMVQTRATSKAALEKIAGVGDARLEKYGPKMNGSSPHHASASAYCIMRSSMSANRISSAG
jgi:superfamily II DNA helicase RecQ